MVIFDEMMKLSSSLIVFTVFNPLWSRNLQNSYKKWNRIGRELGPTLNSPKFHQTSEIESRKKLVGNFML